MYLYVYIQYIYFLAHVPFTRAEFMTYTAAKHQRAIALFWFSLMDVWVTLEVNGGKRLQRFTQLLHVCLPERNVWNVNMFSPHFQLSWTNICPYDTCKIWCQEQRSLSWPAANIYCQAIRWILLEIKKKKSSASNLSEMTMINAS